MLITRLYCIEYAYIERELYMRKWGKMDNRTAEVVRAFVLCLD